MLLLSLSRLSVGEVKRNRARERKKTSRTTGNKNSRPGLSYNNMLLLDSITSPKTQVLLSNFPSISFSLHSHHLFDSHLCHQQVLSPLPISLPVARSISHHISHIFHSSHSSFSSRHPGLSHLLHLFVFWSPFSLWYPLSFHLSLSPSVLIYHWLASGCESLFVTSLIPQPEAHHVQATCFLFQLHK